MKYKKFMIAGKQLYTQNPTWLQVNLSVLPEEWIQQLCFLFDVRNPLEVSEEFIQQFNDAETFEEKERYEEMARKMLERAKVSV